MVPDTLFAIDVPVTDRTRTGVAFTVAALHRVLVLAPDADAATLAAAQMVAIRVPHDHMVIDTRITL